MTPITITYYSDLLCIWAYVAQERVAATKRTFGGEVRFDYRFLNLFGDTRSKIADGWSQRGGFGGYAEHVRGVAARFTHLKLHPDVWDKVQPTSSMSPHLFLAAVLEWERNAFPAIADPDPRIFESVMWAMRRGFFEEGLDISKADVQRALAAPFGVDLAAVERVLGDGTAFARLASDYIAADRARVEGSPTFVLNEGRQKLYGNVGFRVIEANIKELLREPNQDQASWC